MNIEKDKQANPFAVQQNRSITPPNLEVAALKARQDSYDKVLRDFAANIIRLLELQLHTTHMLAGKRLLECPICIRATEEAVARTT